MKLTNRLLRNITTATLAGMGFTAMAQESDMQYFRPNNKHGLNVFETGKSDSSTNKGFKVKIGGNFTQDFQALTHKNSATPVLVNGINTTKLIGLNSGFDLAMANLNIDVQLEDGVRLNLTTYLSTRHHQEAWVKGGYIQFDKLPFLKSRVIDNIMQYVTIKVGDYDVDYGDQHFRRTDGGNAIYNPFVENYIMDEFATEIGGEVYFHSKTGFMAMVGVTDGALNPTVVTPIATDTATGQLNHNTLAFHAKMGYDKQLNKDLRLRLTGSFYTDKSAVSNTLFFGDRTGSHYFLVMENTAATTDANAFSGRYNPQFNEQINTFMINPFVKFKGLEFFGTFEMAQGRRITEPDMRKAIQYAADVVYRFPANKENFWVGARYNSVTATLPGKTTDITINRMVGSIGWFATKNIMLKAEYVNQQYQNFAATDIRSGGEFSGAVVEASIGF